MVQPAGRSIRAFHRHRRYVFFFVAVTLAAAAIAYSVEPIHWIVAICR